MDKMTVGIVGLGLIGGSMAIDLRRRSFASEILGVEAEPVNASCASALCRDASYGRDRVLRTLGRSTGTF